MLDTFENNNPLEREQMYDELIGMGPVKKRNRLATREAIAAKKREALLMRTGGKLSDIDSIQQHVMTREGGRFINDGSNIWPDLSKTFIRLPVHGHGIDGESRNHQYVHRVDDPDISGINKYRAQVKERRRWRHK